MTSTMRWKSLAGHQSGVLIEILLRVAVAL
jgi:hypothetical protein